MKTSTPDHLIAIVLASRDHLVKLDHATAREVVDAIDAWTNGRLMLEQLSGIERDMRRAAAEATQREQALGDHLLGVANWTEETLASARRAARASVSAYLACEELCAAARLAMTGEHTRHVAAAAMRAVEDTTRALAAGAAVR